MATQRPRPDDPVFHPMFRALHRPLTIAGVDRRLFFLALLLGAGTFNLFYSLAAGVLTFSGLYCLGWWATAHDPEMLRIILNSATARRRYDPGKHASLSMRVEGRC